MSKGIASYPESEQKRVIDSRLEHNTGGLGYLAAVDAREGALRRALIEKGLIKPAEKEAEKSQGQ